MSEERQLYTATNDGNGYAMYYVAWDGTKRDWWPANPPTDASCYDCGRPYKIIGDCVIPLKIWNLIRPKEYPGSGILCANCIIERLHVVGVHGVDAKLW